MSSASNPTMASRSAARARRNCRGAEDIEASWGMSSAYVLGSLAEQDAARFFRLHRGCGVDRRGLLIGTLRGGPGRDGLEPALQVREIVEVLALALMRDDPRVGGHVGDGIFAGDE